MELLVALDSEEKASGQLFWDDGESNGNQINCFKNSKP